MEPIKSKNSNTSKAIESVSDSDKKEEKSTNQLPQLNESQSVLLTMLGLVMVAMSLIYGYVKHMKE
ncbi:hypothetical protein [Vagococcus sp.]|uniref:hypothetical protein n=1 Tax=Vagococcus sp. TaxID=1933889 RepID=UPI000EDA2D25|nr:hypothetical protein [Vagococcus sp.]HCT96176.1 hypothetical protein [Vagococcus sp.]